MIRIAHKEDLKAIDYIYNQAVYAKFCTAHLHPMAPKERSAWFNQHDPNKYPIYVYEEEDTILGWAAISPYRKGREALYQTGEISYYVDFKHHGQDIGTRLVEYCLDQSSKLNKRVLLAIIIDGNDASMGLLEKFGFKEWGFLPEVVKDEGEIRGQYYLGKIID